MKNRFVDTVANEVGREKAESLARAGNGLQAALLELEEFDRRHGVAKSGEHRKRLIARCAARLTSFIVQREACGLRDPGYVLDFYRVPAEVAAVIGVRERELDAP
jgi:hypothetical protein